MAGQIFVDVNMDSLDEQGSPQSGGPSSSEDPEQQPSQGALLDEPDETKVFRKIEAKIRPQDTLAKNRDASGTHYGRVRRGVPFSKLKKSEDRSQWKAELPWGIDDTEQPIPNKTDDLCNKVIASLMVDLPKPDPKPGSDSDTDKAAAELAKKFLLADGDESGTNDPEVFRDVADTCLTRSSAFVYVWVDPTAGGWRPKQIMAHPEAVDPTNPLLDAMGQPSEDYVLRYVAQGGMQFTENPAEAERQWLPKHKRRVLLPAHVRCHPATADVANAQAVTLLLYDTLAEAKRRFPELRTMPPEQVKILTQWRPKDAKKLLPPVLQAKLVQDAEAKGVSDDTLVFWYAHFCTVSDDYPDGAEIHVSGADGGMVLSKATLRDDVESGDTVQPVLREIPVAQCRLILDSEDRDPFGRPLVERIGGATATYANMYGAILENIDALLHPNVFRMSTSPVQDYQLTERSGKPIEILTKDDVPQYESPNALPSYTLEVLQELGKDMDNAFAMRDTAQGVDVPTSVSGKAKEIAISQAKVGSEQLRQNFLAFVQRYWRVKLQLAQAKLTIPQQVAFVGTDAAYKQRWFTGADFVGVTDVTIQNGTGTMMGPVEKQSYAAVNVQQGFIDLDEARDIARSSLSEDLGVQRNVHEERVDREIASWIEGPPEGWMSSQPAVDPMTGQPQVDPMTGQPAMQPPSFTPFEPRPHDEEPLVASTRHRKMTKCMATGDYAKHPPEWRALFDAEYQRMAYAAGIQTVRAQAEAQAQAQAQQQQEAAQQQEAQAGEKQADREFQAEQKAQDRDAGMQQTEAKGQQMMQAAQMKQPPMTGAM